MSGMDVETLAALRVAAYRQSPGATLGCLAGRRLQPKYEPWTWCGASCGHRQWIRTGSSR